MPSVNTAICQLTGIISRHAAWLLLLTVLLAGAARAQTTTSTTSVTDGRTPSGLQPGSPAGSYELSGFDNVNLYNGNLDFHLPLLKVGGRGSAGYAMMLALNLKSWHVHHIHKVLPNGDEADSFTPTQTGWVPYGGYGAGQLSGRSYGLQTESSLSCTWYSKTLARLTFSAADGTEYELRDQLTGGQPLTSTCAQGANRGTVFVTADGTSATFISDAPVSDIPTISPLGPRGFSVSGYLMLRDGTRYRIDGGSVTWIRDRNGNQVSFSYTSSSMTVTDPLGRTVTVNYNVSDASPFGLCDQIIFNGFGGAQRIIRVSHTDLGSALRPNSGYALQTPGGANGLFPELSGSTDTLYDPTVASAVWLPDDGVNHRAYHLYYNPYGELARVELPTGGAVEYDMTPGSGVNCGLSSCSSLPDADAEIYRRVVARRVYPDGSTGPNYEHKDVYTNSEAIGTPSSTVTVEQFSSAGTVLARSRHYFDGSALDSLFGGDVSYPYGAWYEGNERQTDQLDTAGNIDTATVLHRIVSTRAQRAPVPWWPSYAATYGLDQSKEPPNDPRLLTTVTTVEPSGANLVSEQTSVSPVDGSVGFDQYNDPTDTWEYDYGVGSPGAFIRRTHTDYVTASAYVNADANPAVGAGLRGLPSLRWVSTDVAGSNKASLMSYSYDQFSLTTRDNITGQCPYYDLPGQPKGQCSTTGPNNEPPSSLATRGNATSVTHFADAANGTGAVTSTASYDIAGNVVTATDPLGNTTTISFDDSFCNDGGVRCGGVFTPGTYAFPKGVTTPVPDASAVYNYPAGTFGSTLSFTISSVHDFYTGLTYSTTDANNKTTALSYKDAQGNPDPLDRLKAVVRPDGSRIDYNYSDAIGNLYVQVLADLDAGRRIESRQYFDGFGRDVRSFRWENQDAGNPWLTVDTQYDALGRAWETSNQYRSATPSAGAPGSINPSGHWTQTTFDSLGRLAQVKTTADGAVVTTAYSGDKVLVTDQAGKQRMSRTDALGRLADVWEVTPADPSTESVTFQGITYTGYHTTYSYDVMGNLRTVTQGMQTRTFSYDSLSRLSSATNPENGTVTYTYDADGNLQTKADARGVTATYYYDHLNRNIIITYTGGGTNTPDVYRYYDNATSGANGLGRLYRSEAAATAQTTFTGYDELGRLIQYQQKFWVGGAWGQPYTVQQGYNKAGGVISEVYPSGHTVNYNYDAAGRVGDNASQPAFAGTLGDGIQRTYSSHVRYQEMGGREQECFGTDTPLYNKALYNSRGQLAEIRLGTIPITDPDPQRSTNWDRGAIINHYSDAPGAWGATGGGPDNNGNLHRQEVFIPNDDQAITVNYTNIVQQYDYDQLNRLTRVYDKPSNGAPDFIQSFSYDRFGNRTVDGVNTTNAPAPQFDAREFTLTNRLYSPGDLDYPDPTDPRRKMHYDAVGNLTYDGYTGAGARAYDAENRMVSAQINASQSANYTYDADGQRVKRNAGGGEVWQVYGIGGELLAEYAANAAPASPQKEYGYRSGHLLVTASLTSGWGDAPVLHDNPLVAGQTTVQSRHITELRDAINALRSHLGLSDYSWQTSAAVGAPVKADPIAEMRTALDQALGAPAGGYSAGLAQGQPILAAHIQELRNRVLAAWQGGTGGVDIRWLVEDQLGTPRMVVDKSGSLSGVRRHDYLPFGEQIQADANWRTAARGYSLGDGVRQEFVSYEHDVETSLDYAQARYYSDAQGRFTSVDPLYFQMMMVIDPQRFNLYAYGRNNPFKWVDPNGEHLFLRGDLAWLRMNVLYEMVGGQEIFDDYFEIVNGQVVLKAGIDQHELLHANEGVQELAALVAASENYVYYAGTDGEAVADLFQGSRNKKGKLTTDGKHISHLFTCKDFESGCGTVTGVSGKTDPVEFQPNDLPNGDHVFAVIAYNTDAVQTETSTNYGTLNPVPADVKAAQEAGVGQVVRPASFFIHESTEKQKYAEQGAGNMDYDSAHAHAIEREAVIRKSVHITGGFAGARLQTKIPKDK